MIGVLSNVKTWQKVLDRKKAFDSQDAAHEGEGAVGAFDEEEWQGIEEPVPEPQIYGNILVTWERRAWTVNESRTLKELVRWVGGEGPKEQLVEEHETKAVAEVVARQEESQIEGLGSTGFNADVAAGSVESCEQPLETVGSKEDGEITDDNDDD